MTNTINFAEARHLVSRSGLGVEWKQIKNLEGRTRRQAVEILLRPKTSLPPAPPKMTSWHVRTNMYESKNPKHKMKMHEMTVIEGARLKRWWISHMLKTQSPIVEKMTLFWHGHFTSSLDKVEQPRLLYKQNIMFRRHAMGNFATLLKAVAKDPAMTVYLDGMLNEKNNPNENFARELLELFTLGRKHYSESDVRNVARAFTGSTVDRFRETYAFNKADHDVKPKFLLGKRIQTADDVIRVVLEHPRTAMTIAEKFWNLFVSDTEPDRRITNLWAKKFRNSRYDIRTLLREVLNSDVFWSDDYKGTVTKSPVDLVIGSLRTIPTRRFNEKELEGILRLLGQDLFDPANVKGWKNGLDWIDAETIMVRSSMVNKLTSANLNEKVNTGKQYPDAPPEQYKEWLLPQPPISPPPTKPGKVRLVRTLALDPLYQLM